ncbi:Zinc finger, PHD-type, conserved site [Phytophthora cactorum]|nr:Zinc finger, PHD-type, conserved site [Phytophthora cactorum]
MTQVEEEAAALSGTMPVAAEAPKSKPTKPAGKGDAKTKSKPKPKAKPKPPTNTLDRWFKPAISAVKDKKPSDKPKEPEAAAVVKDAEKPVVQKKAKPVGASRNFVQRYIHINDECRVCECAKTEEAARCELRCVTCSMTVHKKCYDVKGELPDGDWNCRRCQFIYDETAWEDISGLIGMATPEGVSFPKCKPLDDKHKLHKLQTDCDFAAVFLFLQRFRRLGLKLSNVVTTLESLANALLEPKEEGLCEELHTRLLANINVGMKKYPWYVHLLCFLREERYPPAIAQDTKYPATTAEAEKREEFYFDLPMAEKVAILKFLCEAQFDRNETLIEQIDDEEAESMVGGTDWETVCNDLESVESLVEQLSLSVDSADLKLWQTLSRGALKKLTRQQERRRRNERWKNELAVSGVMGSSANFEGIGRRSLRNRQQVNYANIDAEEEEEDIVADSDKSNDEEEAFEAKSDNDAASETDGDDDEEGEDQPRRSTRNSVSLAKKRKAEHRSTRSSKRIRRSSASQYSHRWRRYDLFLSRRGGRRRLRDSDDE